jgi:hypothetical protein
MNKELLKKYMLNYWLAQLVWPDHMTFTNIVHNHLQAKNWQYMVRYDLIHFEGRKHSPVFASFRKSANTEENH